MNELSKLDKLTLFFEELFLPSVYSSKDTLYMEFRVLHIRRESREELQAFEDAQARIEAILTSRSVSFDAYSDKNAFRVFVELQKEKISVLSEITYVFRNLDCEAFFRPSLLYKEKNATDRIPYKAAPIRIFWNDIDNNFASEEEAQAWLEKISDVYKKDFDCRPAAVFSGHGIHLYFSSYQSISTAENFAWRTYQDALSASIQDGSKVDIGRLHASATILRLPYTFNRKDERKSSGSAIETKILSFFKEAVPNREKLEARFEDLAEKNRARIVKSPIDLSSDSDDFFELSSYAKDELVKVLSEFFIDGYRQTLSLCFSGRCYNSRVSVESAASVIKELAFRDRGASHSDADEFLNAVTNTYRRAENAIVVSNKGRFEETMLEIGHALGMSEAEINHACASVRELLTNPEDRRITTTTSTKTTLQEFEAKDPFEQEAEVRAELDELISQAEERNEFSVSDVALLSREFFVKLAKLRLLSQNQILSKISQRFSMTSRDLRNVLNDEIKRYASDEAKKNKKENLLFSVGSSVYEVHPSIDFNLEAQVFSFGFKRHLRQVDGVFEGSFKLLSRNNVIACVDQEVCEIPEFGLTRAIATSTRGQYPSLDCAGLLPMESWNISDILDFHKSPSFDRQLLKRIASTLRRHIYIEDERSYLILAAYCLLTFIFPIFPAIPFIELRGNKESGKTELFRLLSKLCFNATVVSGATAASLSDQIQWYRSTILYDQAEKLQESMLKDPALRELTGLLAGSYTANGSIRQVLDTSAKNGRTLHITNLFSPKILASNAGLNHDLQDRMIPILMTGLPDEKKIVRITDVVISETLSELRAQCYRFAIMNWSEVRDIYFRICEDSCGAKRLNQLLDPLKAIMSFFDVDFAFLDDYIENANSSRGFEFEEALYSPICVAVAACAALYKKTKFAAEESSALLTFTDLHSAFPEDLHARLTGEELSRSQFKQLLTRMRVAENMKRRRNMTTAVALVSYESLDAAIRKFFGEKSGISIESLLNEYEIYIK